MGKRANGEGTVYQRKDRRWVASIVLDNGKRKSVYCKTQKEAVRVVRGESLAKEQGMLSTGADQLLSTFLTAWLEDTAQYNVRPRTFIRYRGIVNLHILPTLGKIKLQKLSAQHLQKLYNQKRQEGYAPQSVKHIHRVLHRALNDAVRWDLVSRNVCNLIDPPRVPKQEMKALTDEQALRFLEAVHGDPLEALYIVALTTGMRQGEILALTWNAIDLAHGTLQVRQTIARIGKQGFVISEPKTAKSRRSIHLTALALEALKRHRVQQHKQRQTAGPAWRDHNWVFCNAVGQPIEAGNLLRRSYWPLLEKAGLERMPFHSLRHSAASLLLSLGVHPKVVQELLGHSNISMTLDTYSHVLPTMHEDAAKQLNGLLSRAKNPVAVTVAVNEAT